jgi:hypothetical protein
MAQPRAKSATTRERPEALAPSQGCKFDSYTADQWQPAAPRSATRPRGVVTNFQS